jgi:hypothetical protein
MSDSPSAVRAQSHRAEAKRLREQAAQMPWPDLREQLEKIAGQYDLLADDIERKPSEGRAQISN